MDEDAKANTSKTRSVEIDRVVDLESRLALADRQIEDLSDVVADQSARLSLLEARVAKLMEQALSSASDGSLILGDEPPPPHW